MKAKVQGLLREAAALLPKDLALGVKNLEQSIDNGMPLRVAIFCLADQATKIDSLSQHDWKDEGQIRAAVPLMYKALHELVVARMGRSYLGGGNDGL